MPTQVPDRAQVPVKPKRGRETALDMVRSLALVLLPVLLLWFLARPPSSDVAEVRVVDPAPDVAALSAEVPGARVPTGLPEGWRSTSSTLEPDPRRLRIGYVTPSERYAEYAASTGAPAEHVDALTGAAPYVGEVQAGGRTWREHRESDGSLSLVRTEGALTIVLGSRRGSATIEELQVLAESLAAR